MTFLPICTLNHTKYLIENIKLKSLYRLSDVVDISIVLKLVYLVMAK